MKCIIYIQCFLYHNQVVFLYIIFHFSYKFASYLNFPRKSFPIFYCIVLKVHRTKTHIQKLIIIYLVFLFFTKRKMQVFHSIAASRISQWTLTEKNNKTFSAVLNGKLYFVFFLFHWIENFCCYCFLQWYFYCTKVIFNFKKNI